MLRVPVPQNMRQAQQPGLHPHVADGLQQARGELQLQDHVVLLLFRQATCCREAQCPFALAHSSPASEAHDAGVQPCSCSLP